MIKIRNNEIDLGLSLILAAASDVAAEIRELADRLSDAEYTPRLCQIADVLDEPLAYAQGDCDLHFEETLDPTISDAETRWLRSVKAIAQARRREHT